MHIPDGFLSTPVWLALDAAALPAVVYAGKYARIDSSDTKAPLLGVMGAFVFAAQMINFPVGLGASGHLIGAALLAFTLGPAAAMIVLTAILGLQALIFQDGGVLALGANVINMAVIGVLAAWLPYKLAGSHGSRSLGIFLGAALSVFVTGSLALAELAASGVRMPLAVTGVTLGLFAATGILEGFITVAVLRALHRMNPGWDRQPSLRGRPAMALLASAAIVLATFGVLFASANPDSLEQFAERTGIVDNARIVLASPLAGYQAAALTSPWLQESVAGWVGIALIFLVCVVIGRTAVRGGSP